MERAEGIVLVIRNPYDAILADFNRQMSGSHTGSTDYSKFKGEVWENFVKQHAGRWVRFFYNIHIICINIINDIYNDDILNLVGKI